ncbi:hypothetical protein [Pseudomonas putida]|uniref:hypothetical protein n=1 Tax=Pseudomonas putida TaxID=303 RepID=UPI0021193BBC|nr:hypothetical protein [Pseudomonas putida]
MSNDRNVSGSELGLMVCKALGIAPDGVVEVSIRMLPHEPATVRVDQNVPQAQAGLLIESIGLYELKKIGN